MSGVGRGEKCGGCKHMFYAGCALVVRTHKIEYACIMNLCAGVSEKVSVYVYVSMCVLVHGNLVCA